MRSARRSLLQPRVGEGAAAFPALVARDGYPNCQCLGRQAPSRASPSPDQMEQIELMDQLMAEHQLFRDTDEGWLAAPGSRRGHDLWR